MTTPPQRAADLADAFTPFAPRLDTYWFTCERVEPVGKTVRYTVRLKDDARTVVGDIAWSHRHNCYAITGGGSWDLVAKSLHDLGEICQYLTQRQRRRPTGRAR